LPNISNQHRIGLYHLYFIQQDDEEEIEDMEQLDHHKNSPRKKKYKRHIMSLNMTIKGRGARDDSPFNGDGLSSVRSLS
jgi:hypothetical protein